MLDIPLLDCSINVIQLRRCNVTYRVIYENNKPVSISHWTGKAWHGWYECWNTQEYLGTSMQKIIVISDGIRNAMIRQKREEERRTKEQAEIALMKKRSFKFNEWKAYHKLMREKELERECEQAA